MAKHYVVSWEIDVEGDDSLTPEQAAREALAIQRKPDSIATVFTVRNGETDEGVQVDLTPEDEV